MPTGSGHSDQLMLNKFFDLSTSSLKNKEPSAKSKMPAKVPQNGRRGLEKCPHLGFWALPSIFDLSTPSMRKGDDGETGKNRGKKGKKIKMFLVATNVVASRPTGTYDAGSYQIVGNL